MAQAVAVPVSVFRQCSVLLQLRLQRAGGPLQSDSILLHLLQLTAQLSILLVLKDERERTLDPSGTRHASWRVTASAYLLVAFVRESV